MKCIKVCAITGSRAEYSIFYPVLKALNNSKHFVLKIVAHGMHNSTWFGNTYKEIERDGFAIDFKAHTLDESKDRSSMAISVSNSIAKLSPYLEKTRPDIVLIVGDRFETHAAATASLLLNIPIAHIHGGEISEGAVDEQLRHSITKMSHLHFCSNEIHRKRLIQMGEQPNSVFNVGAPALDNIKATNFFTKEDIQEKLKWNWTDKLALVTYHPETLDDKKLEENLNSFLSSLTKIGIDVIFTYSNADNGGKKINELLELFCKNNPKKYKILENLGIRLYLSVMSICDVVIGNSSSGIIEAASFFKPVINVGKRQEGRMKGPNVIDSSFEEIEKSYHISMSNVFLKSIENMKNPYGDGNTAERIKDVLLQQSPSLQKKFYDLDCK